ncbi:MAG: hypothetical protein IJG57_04180 [Firmicutes bacterium]|nr:hypothetical protein [Bacillota bacterium]
MKVVIRLLLTILGAALGYSLGILIYMLAVTSFTEEMQASAKTVEIATPVVGAVIVGALAFFISGRMVKNWGRIGQRLETNISRFSAFQLIGGGLGLILGLLAAYLISGLLGNIRILYLGTVLSVIAYIIFGGMFTLVGARLGKQLSDRGSGYDMRTSGAAYFQNRRNAPRKRREAIPKIFDTSVLIDGRIMDLMKTGFIEGDIIIPEYVLTELRHLSDSSDPIKKAKGRRGLAVLKDIRSYYGIEIYNTYSDKDWDGVEEVDVKLLRLAQKLDAKVVTNDFNLIQVAEIQEIPVLNINDVVNALRTVVIPGEDLKVSVIREGRENNQGVGYMPDGTMIVVEGGKSLIGKDVNTEVTSVLQTASGRMIFAKPRKTN